MGEVFIVDFEERHLNDFKKLGYEWLLKYDLLEPVDEEMLNNPKEKIIDEGGFVCWSIYSLFCAFFMHKIFL
mgnify:CR=1 FL=1